MSKGFIGLDNPSFQGNLRVYRRREVARPQRPTNRPVGILDDVSETSTLAQNNVQPIQQTSLPAPIAENKQSPLQVPVGLTSSAGSEFVATHRPIAQQASQRPTRSQRFEQWQQSQLAPQQKPEFVEQITEKSTPQQDAGVVSFEQFLAEQQKAPKAEVAEVSAEKLKQKKSKLRFLRKTPFFGKLTRKDIFTMKFALPAMAVAIFLFGCGIAIQGVLTNRHVKAQVSEMAGGVTGYDPTGKDEVPDETKPDESAGPYIVAPNMPRYIRVNKIGVMSRIIRVGVKPNNELIAPNNIHTVGWYEGSQLPGEKGTALLDAHVHGPTMPGAFYKIHDLNPGDEIEIEMGDGRRFYYTVAAKESQPYQNVDMSKAMRSIEDGKNGLNLITCGGRYNRDIHMYEERVVVYAVQK